MTPRSICLADARRSHCLDLAERAALVTCCPELKSGCQFGGRKKERGSEEAFDDYKTEIRFAHGDERSGRRLSYYGKFVMPIPCAPFPVAVVVRAPSVPSAFKMYRDVTSATLSDV